MQKALPRYLQAQKMCVGGGGGYNKWLLLAEVNNTKVAYFRQEMAECQSEKVTHCLLNCLKIQIFF